MKISKSGLAIARDKVLRAYRHYLVAERLIRRSIRRDCGLKKRFNAKTQEFDVIAKLPPPPVLLGLVVGDCVHNLRSALDHIVYALVVSNAKRPADTPNAKTMFPIADTRAGFERQVQKLGRIRGVPADATSLIESFQPFHVRERGDDHTLNPLWVLNRLDNIDKHRRLTLASAVARHAHIRVRYADGGEMDMLHLQEEIYDGAILTSYPPARDGSDVEMDGYLMVYVALREIDELSSLDDVDVMYVLRFLIDHVGNQILPKFGVFAGLTKQPRQRRQDLRPKLRR